MQVLSHYFPGGNTPEGFYSFYHEILDHKKTGKLAVIKGGPGTGKSTFLKKLGKTLEHNGEIVTYLHCSSDPVSLDGIYLPRCNSAVIDGTAPHLTDARYLGAYDTVLNFCDFIGPIADGEPLVSESRLAKTAFSEGYSYLKSAKALLDFMQQQSEAALLDNEIRSFALNIAKRVSSFSAKGYKKTGFLSAVTADGFRNFFSENLKDYYVICLETEIGDNAQRILEEVQNACRLRNADMITCPCPMNPKKAEHLIFPSANLAIVTSNTFHPYGEADEIIPFSDFITDSTYDTAMQTLYSTLLCRTVESFAKARQHHNRMEEIYKTVTDYSAITTLHQKAMDFLMS